jgi:hypothetical protein
MEQKDYLMREIGKIGTLLRAALAGLLNMKENLSVQAEKPFETTNELLKNEAGFDLEGFLRVPETDAEKYLHQFKGLNPENLALLAEVILHLGAVESSSNKKIFLGKALLLLELCERTDKTFSFERERKINEINNSLLQIPPV